MQTFPPYRFLVDPLPGVWNIWPWLLVPLCIGISIAYKSIKCASMRTVPREAAVICFWILLGMGAAAGLLAGIVYALEYFSR